MPTTKCDHKRQRGVNGWILVCATCAKGDYLVTLDGVYRRICYGIHDGIGFTWVPTTKGKAP